MGKKTEQASKRDTQAAVNEACRTLRKAYRTGREIRKRCSMQGSYGAKAIDREAESRGLNVDTARKLRHFADRDKGYTWDELNDLVKLCRKHGRALGVSFVHKLLTVPKKKNLRKQFEEEMIVGRWSRAKVDAELRERFGRRRQGGRRKRIPKSKEGLLAQIDGLCLTWKRWYEQVAGDGNKNEKSAVPIDKLPEDVQDQLRATMSHIEKLNRAVSRHMDT